MKQILWISLLIVFLSSHANAQHNPVLPKPQKISYGKGSIPLKGLSIGFAGKPAQEDIFAAKELAKAISNYISASTPVNESSKSGSNIIFERTGSLDPLPVPGEKGGPDSRVPK
jgi:hypothetical protein